MRLVETLLVRDEADIVDAHLRFQLNAGVDFVIATDHLSEDGTTEVLESYARDGVLELFTETGERIEQSRWVTRMARLAATEYGADWVINSDADEFWWPRARSLKEALAVVPEAYGVVYGPMYYFLPLRGDGPFHEVMTVRVAQHAPLNNPLGRYRPSMKAAHRGRAEVLVLRGNHEVEGGGPRLRFWHPFEVFHFPDRSPEQIARKYAHMISAWPEGGREPGAFVLAAHGAVQREGVERSFDRLAVPSDRLSTVSDDAVLTRDTRLRDAMRVLTAKPDEAMPAYEFERPSPADDSRHAVEVGALVQAEVVRLHRRVDDLGQRLELLERRRLGRTRRPRS